jgi:acetylornithine/N-succinyldiaminopimelate aminotransferase
MELFDVYPLMDLEPVTARGCTVTGHDGRTYLDLYGGHAVISVGHSHPHYLDRMRQQMGRIGFYSNAVRNPLQVELAALLGRSSGYGHYHLFLCNSGAEANENALKLASFHNGRAKVLAFSGSFHGRTSAAVACTHDATIQAPLNSGHQVVFAPLNDLVAAERAVDMDTAAVIVEGIQGVGGVHEPSFEFLHHLRALCDRTGALLVMDEVQSGYGRTGHLFAHQHSGVRPDLITVAKGMGNGFPIGGVLVHPSIKARYGLLGTTFGGSHLACAAALAVLEIIQAEDLVARAAEVGKHVLAALQAHATAISPRGRGLMLAFDVPGTSSAPLRQHLLTHERLLVGSAKPASTVRLLPPLVITQTEAQQALGALQRTLRLFVEPQDVMVQ